MFWSRSMTWRMLSSLVGWCGVAQCVIFPTSSFLSDKRLFTYLPILFFYGVLNKNLYFLTTGRLYGREWSTHTCTLTKENWSRYVMRLMYISCIHSISPIEHFLLNFLPMRSDAPSSQPFFSKFWALIRSECISSNVSPTCVCERMMTLSSSISRANAQPGKGITHRIIG